MANLMLIRFPQLRQLMQAGYSMWPGWMFVRVRPTAVSLRCMQKCCLILPTCKIAWFLVTLLTPVRAEFVTQLDTSQQLTLHLYATWFFFRRRG